MNIAASLDRVAAATRSIERASSSVAGFVGAVRTIDRLRMGLGPGSLLHDLVVLANRGAADARRMGAARHLARHYATRRAVFHPNRWEFVRDEFNVRRDGRDRVVAWAELAAPALLLALDSIPGDTLLVDGWRELRCRVRAEIERDLLCRTLDSKTEGPIAGDAEPAAPQELMHAVDLRLDDLTALQGLEPAARYLLIEYDGLDSAGRKALAERLGVSYDTLRQRASRLSRKLKRFHR